MTDRIDEVIVVEGNHDAARILAIFPQAHTLITQGAAISEATLTLLKRLNQTQGLILMLDPDYPGQRIRRIINDAVGETKHVFIPREACTDTHKRKVGIEHASEATIRQALQAHVHTHQPAHVSVTPQDMVNLKLTGYPGAKARREKVAKAFYLDEVNAKTLRKRLNMFAIDVASVKAVLTP